MKISKKDIPKIILEKTFPEYTGRKFFLKFTNIILFTDTNWSGGTRNQYCAFNLDNLKSSIFNAPAPWLNPIEGKAIEIPENCIVVMHTIFLGHDCGLTIYASNSNFLPEKVCQKLLAESEVKK